MTAEKNSIIHIMQCYISVQEGSDRYESSANEITTYIRRPGASCVNRFGVRLQEEARRKEVNEWPLISTNLLVPLFESKRMKNHVWRARPAYYARCITEHYGILHIIT